MKKRIWIIFILSTLCFIVSVINTMSDLEFLSFQIQVLMDVEFYTLLLNHILVILCIIYSIKAIAQEKTPLYLITIILPIAYILVSWYFFFIRILSEIFA